MSVQATWRTPLVSTAALLVEEGGRGEEPVVAMATRPKTNSRRR
jgi:hypothetical protein